MRSKKDVQIEIYWINLSSRKDKAAHSSQQLRHIDLKANQIVAIDRKQVGKLIGTANQHYFQGVVACKRSHFKAYKLFLQSENHFACILEDDFVLSKECTTDLFYDLVGNMTKRQINFLQIGFLPFGYSIRGYPNYVLRIIRFPISYLTNTVRKFLGDMPMVHGKIKPGSHAYIIDRDTAKYLLSESKHNLKLPLDLWLSDLGGKQIFAPQKIFFSRLRKSIVAQAEDFKSDLQN